MSDLTKISSLLENDLFNKRSLENEEELFEDLVSLIWSSTFELTHVLLYYCEYQGGVLYCIRNKGEYKTRWWGALLSSFWHMGFQKI